MINLRNAVIKNEIPKNKIPDKVINVALIKKTLKNSKYFLFKKCCNNYQ